MDSWLWVELARAETGQQRLPQKLIHNIFVPRTFWVCNEYRKTEISS
jgi:hypothetical protein